MKITVLTFQANQKYNESFRGAVYFLRISEKTFSQISYSWSFFDFFVVKVSIDYRGRIKAGGEGRGGIST